MNVLLMCVCMVCMCMVCACLYVMSSVCVCVLGVGVDIASDFVERRCIECECVCYVGYCCCVSVVV